MCTKFGGATFSKSGDKELWTQQLLFLSSGTKNTQAADSAQAEKPPGQKRFIM